MFDTEPTRDYPSLAKLAAFFASVFIICIGICGLTTYSGKEFGGRAGFLSFVGMAISAVALIVIGIAAVIERVRDLYSKMTTTFCAKNNLQAKSERPL